MEGLLVNHLEALSCLVSESISKASEGNFLIVQYWSGVIDIIKDFEGLLCFLR